MTSLLPLASRRSRFLFDLSAKDCLAAPDQSLNANTGQVATYTRASVKAAYDVNSVSRVVPHSLPAFQWATDPSSGLSVPGILLEGARTNLFLWSDDFNNPAWSKTNITVTVNTVSAPDGSTTADKLAATASAATSCTQSVVIVGTACAQSFYIKQGSGATDANRFALRNVTTSTNIAAATFNYATGVLTVTSGGGYVEPLFGGWYRVTLIATIGITSGNTVQGYCCFDGSGETAGEFAYVWRGQMEVGAASSSSIQTTTVAATRSADLLTYALNALPAAMTVYAKFIELGSIANAGGFGGVLLIGDPSGVTGNQFYVSEDGAGHYRAVDRTVSSALAAAPTIAQSTELRGILNADGSVQIGQSINAAAEATGAASAALTLPSAWSGPTLVVGSLVAGVSNPAYMLLQSLRIASGVQSMSSMRSA